MIDYIKLFFNYTIISEKPSENSEVTTVKNTPQSSPYMPWDVKWLRNSHNDESEKEKFYGIDGLTKSVIQALEKSKFQIIPTEPPLSNKWIIIERIDGNPISLDSVDWGKLVTETFINLEERPGFSIQITDWKVFIIRWPLSKVRTFSLV